MRPPDHCARLACVSISCDGKLEWNGDDPGHLINEFSAVEVVSQKASIWPRMGDVVGRRYQHFSFLCFDETHVEDMAKIKHLQG
jgi:hypothetical protein